MTEEIKLENITDEYARKAYFAGLLKGLRDGWFEGFQDGFVEHQENDTTDWWNSKVPNPYMKGEDV